MRTQRLIIYTIVVVCIMISKIHTHANSVYKIPSSDTLVGSISGRVIPSDVPCVICAEERGGEYGGVAYAEPDGSFKISRLAPGTYDLVLVPDFNVLHTPYYVNAPESAGLKYTVFAGQYVPEEYKGNSLSNDDRNVLENIIKRDIPGTFTSAYTHKSTRIADFSHSISPIFRDELTSAPLGGILPNVKRGFDKGMEISRHTQDRTIRLLKGNEKNAAAICHVKEEITMPFYFIGRKEENRIERINAEKTDDYTYFDLCLLEKFNEQWKLTLRQPVRHRVFTFPSVCNAVKNLQIKFCIEGQLVGVVVSEDKNTDIGIVTLEEWKK